ncbi:MAG: hypothetical protein EZS28_044701, partial [Streblomastix strix]
MGIGKASYEVKDEEQASIQAQIDLINKSVYVDQEKIIAHYILSHALYLTEMNKSYTMMLVRGRMLHEQPTHRGWVEKEGGSIKSWKRRILQLNISGELVYYEDEEKERKGESKGKLSVAGYSVSE